MKIECVDIEQIAGVLASRADDPVRRHVDECPRCSSLAAAFSSFAEAEVSSLPAGADPGDAEARLMRFLEDEIGAVETTLPVREPVRSDEGFLAKLIAGFAGLRMRPALVAAAIVLVAAVVVWQTRTPEFEENPVLRGVGMLPLIEVQDEPVIAGDSLQIHWESVEGADGYRFVLFDQDLDAFFSVEIGPEAAYVLNRSALPEDAPRVAICRIAALSDGDEIAETAPFPLRLP